MKLLLLTSSALLWGGIVFFTLSCNPEPSTTDPEIPFTGVTLMDENGASLGVSDPSDWRTDDIWVAKEKALFPATKDLKNCPSDPTLEAYACAPNPTPGRLFLGYHLPDSMEVDVCNVDRDFKTLNRWDAAGLGPGYNLIVLDMDSIPLKDTIRVYYQIRRPGVACAVRGHGDVILK